MVQRLIARAARLYRRTIDDRRGAVAVLFALSALVVVTAVGCGLDLATGYAARQQLSAVASLTCQYANRPMVLQLAYGSGGATAYAASVNKYEAQAFAAQNVSWAQATSAPFTYTTAGPGNVTLAASIPTSIMNVVGITSMPVSVTQQCFATPGSGPTQPVPDATSPVLVSEGFENSAIPNGYVWYEPHGTNAAWASGTTMSAVNTAGTTAGYIGSGGSQWIIMGYCLEVDAIGFTASTAAEGSHSAELDCDNGHGTAGNSSISTKTYMATGTYELRWNYTGRVYNDTYKTSYVCGTAASDTSWANDNVYSINSLTLGARTDQINVYLDLDTTGSPPVHTTLDGTQQLGGSNLIDECVYALSPSWNSSLAFPGNISSYPYGWIERSVPITITTAGYYWLSFAADGASDSYGGLVDNIRLCQVSCTGTLADNFPPSWLSTSTNVMLFEDTFETPADPASNEDTTRSLASYYGSSYYWSQQGKGWSNAPTNVIYLRTSTSKCPQSNTCPQLGGGAASPDTINDLFSKPFLLVPGYYEIIYDYASELLFSGTKFTTDFPTNQSQNGAWCGTTPSAAGMSASLYQTGKGTDRISGTTHSGIRHDTNAVGVFMSHAQMASTPDIVSSAATIGATTTYTNTALNADGSIALNVAGASGSTAMLYPDGKTVLANAAGTPVTTSTTTPTKAPNDINLTASPYTQSATSPLLDMCGYASTPQTRSQAVQIQKTGFYWLTFAAFGAADGYGGQIDDVRIQALGSPLMKPPPAGAVLIPVPSPQPGATTSYTGFSIKTDLH